jgi:hypothetical protein
MKQPIKCLSTGWTTRFRFSGGMGCLSSQTLWPDRLWRCPRLSNVYLGAVQGKQRGRVLKLTVQNYLYLVSKYKTRGAWLPRAVLSGRRIWETRGRVLKLTVQNYLYLVSKYETRGAWLPRAVFLFKAYCLSTEIALDLGKSRISGFGGLEDACWPLLPKFAGSNPAEVVGFFRAKKSAARLPSEGK